jgi:hypothetical protein
VTAETEICPWCSASVPVAATTCPSCGAALRDAAAGDIAGVTQLDPSAMLRTKRIKPRGLAAWLVGEREVEEPSVGKVEPPSDAVRKEMRRLEIAAIAAELDAKTAAAEANRELGIDSEAPATPDDIDTTAKPPAGTVADADADADAVPASHPAPHPASDPASDPDQPA